MQHRLHSQDAAFEAYRVDTQSRARRLSRFYKCRCGGRISFNYLSCPTCTSQLGYLPDEGRMAALDPGPEPETWIAAGRDEVLKFCANRGAPAACNWMVFADNPAPFCVACRLNRTIPDLSDADNARYWARIEAAKRRVVSQLIALGSPVRSKLYDDPENGLMFDFLRSAAKGPQIMTGHDNGLITLNVEEADSARREQIRHAMGEPYRTLLGHFRHEIGHYYWDRLIRDSQWLEPFREVFGDERASYEEALKRNYEQGPPADWAQSYISAYASMHPWEDWAETWAHYLHILDGLGTAMGFGLDAADIDVDFTPFGKEACHEPADRNTPRFLQLLNGWRKLVVVLNEMARSMGQPDFYPFHMSARAAAKLQFVQMVVFDARTQPRL